MLRDVFLSARGVASTLSDRVFVGLVVAALLLERYVPDWMERFAFYAMVGVLVLVGLGVLVKRGWIRSRRFEAWIDGMPRIGDATDREIEDEEAIDMPETAEVEIGEEIPPRRR